jgi:hypothetical protein
MTYSMTQVVQVPGYREAVQVSGGHRDPLLLPGQGGHHSNPLHHSHIIPGHNIVEEIGHTLDEGVEGSGKGLFLIVGHLPKILLQNSKGGS